MVKRILKEHGDEPLLTGGEPTDVFSYRAQHAMFPHETTLDQWFDEPQFESYRERGQRVASHALAARWPDRG